jgi:hypothetical protein
MIFKTLFNKKAKSIKKKYTFDSIFKFPLSQNPPEYLKFLNFRLEIGCKSLEYINEYNYITKEVVDISNNSYVIRTKNIRFKKYRKGELTIKGEKYSYFTDDPEYNKIYFIVNTSLKNCSRNRTKKYLTLLYDNVFVENLIEDCVYISDIDNTENTEFSGLNKIFEIIFTVSRLCNILNLKIIDDSQILFENQKLQLWSYRMLCNKHESIYNKYGFYYKKDPLTIEQRDYIKKFTLKKFISELETI